MLQHYCNILKRWVKEATVKDNIVGQGGKGEDNWTIGFRQHGHQGVTPWVASHAFLVIIIVSIIIVIIVSIIVIPWMASFIKSSCLPTDRGGNECVSEVLSYLGTIFIKTFWVQWGQESNVLDQNLPGCPC